MLCSRRSILVAAFLTLLLLATPVVGAQAEAGKESCRWIIHEPTISICVKLPDPSPGESEEQQRAVMSDLLRRIDELKKLAAISADLHWLKADIENSYHGAEREKRIRTIGKTSRSLCRDRNVRSACQGLFRADSASSEDSAEKEVVLRTMQTDVLFCMRSLKDSGTFDIHYPERLQNIAAGAARLSALVQADGMASASR